MKLKEGFVLREVADSIVVIPCGDDLDLNMMITLNGTGKFLWERLTEGAQEEELVQALLAEYDVSEEMAKQAVEDFVAKLKEHDFLA